MVFARFALQDVTWLTRPETFASSTVVERGVCRACGTPLSYRQVDSPNISVTLHSRDEPDAVPPPEVGLVTECRPEWLRRIDALPDEAYDQTTIPGFVSHQRR